MSQAGLSALLGFSSEEDGAVTVDWVVLTAVVVGLAIGLVPIITSGIFGLSSEISDAVLSVATF